MMEHALTDGARSEKGQIRRMLAIDTDVEMKHFGAIECMLLGISTNDQYPAPQGQLTYDILHEFQEAQRPGFALYGQPSENG
jgi:hypothetical protein